MPEFDIKISPKVIVGSYELSRLGSETDHFGPKALLISEKALRAKAMELEEIMASQGVETLTYLDTNDGNTTLGIAEVVKVARMSRVNMIIALGGINTCSLAKATAVLAPTKSTADDFYNEDMILKVSLPYIEIPATGRNPFMLMDLCPVVDSRTRKLRFCSTPAGTAKLIIIDPSLLLNLPKNYLQLFLVEAIFLAAENYLIARSSFFSDIQALAALKRFSWLLTELEVNAENPMARQVLAEGSLLSAFSQSMIGLTPGLILSYATASFFKVPKASVSAILAPHFLESALYPATEKMAEVASLFGKDDNSESGLSDRIRASIGHFDLPSRLSDLGLKMGNLSAASDIAGDIAADNLPGVNKEEFFNLLKDSF